LLVLRAAVLVDDTERWSERAFRERGTAWAFGSDELYILAGRRVPQPSHYGEFAQIENGVGAVTKLLQTVRDHADTLPRLDGTRVGIVTGASLGRTYMPEIVERLRDAGQYVVGFSQMESDNPWRIAETKSQKLSSEVGASVSLLPLPVKRMAAVPPVMVPALTLDERDTPPEPEADGSFERVPLPWVIKRRFLKVFLRDVHHYLFDTEHSPRPVASDGGRVGGTHARMGGYLLI
jgi:hypothetical protein